MDDLYHKYERSLWHSNENFEAMHPDLVEKTKLEEIWDWEDYAIEQWLKILSDPPRIEREMP